MSMKYEKISYIRVLRMNTLVR